MFWRGLASALACLSALAFATLSSGAAVGADAEPAPTAPFAPATLAARVSSLAREYSRPPEEVLADLQALRPLLAAAPLRIQDAARLIEIDKLLSLGRVNDAEAIAIPMQTEPRRDGDSLATSRADLALLRVILVKSPATEASAVASRLLARREAWRGDDIEIEVLQWSAATLDRRGETAASAAMVQEALSIAERTGVDERKPALLVDLCGVHHKLRQLAKAREYCAQARGLALALNDKRALLGVASHLAEISGEMGDADGQLRELETALALAQTLKFKRGEALAEAALADHANRQKSWKKAAAHARAGLALAETLSDRSLMAGARIHLGFAQAHLGDVAVGIKAYEQGLKALEAGDELESLVECLPGMAELYTRAGRLPEAMGALRRRVEEGEKLYQRSQSKALADMQGRFDAAQREKEILLLKRDNELKSATLEAKQLQQSAVVLVGGVLVVVGAALLLAYRRMRKINQALADSNAELAFQSDHDPLTGLFNRRSLQLFLELSRPSARPGAEPRSPLGFVLADIDHFKRVNDLHGHAAGDAVLIEFGRRLASLVRPGDRVFRWGGEEFLLLLTEGSAAGLADLCKRILEAMAREPFDVGGQRIALTVSLGACPFPLWAEEPLARDWQRHLHFADLALYRAKATGRNRAIDIVSIADASASTLAAIEADLDAAAAEGLATVLLIEPGLP